MLIVDNLEDIEKYKEEKKWLIILSLRGKMLLTF